MVKTPCSQYKGPKFNPWSGNYIHMLQLENLCATRLKILCVATKTQHSQIN